MSARDLRDTGEKRPECYLQTAHKHLVDDALSEMNIDYLELVDRDRLTPLAEVTGPALLATAVSYDKVRLIDNVEF